MTGTVAGGTSTTVVKDTKLNGPSEHREWCGRSYDQSCEGWYRR